MDVQGINTADIKTNKFYAINVHNSRIVELRYFGSRYVVVGELFADSVVESAHHINKFNDDFEIIGGGIRLLEVILSDDVIITEE